MALFTVEELSSYLQYATTDTVDTQVALTVERAVSGWLLGRIGLAEWPVAWDTVPEPLWALAVELGAIVFENPTALSSEGLGASSTTWGKRRQEIADELRSWARAAGIVPDEAGSPSLTPRGGFPPARPWPGQHVSHGSPLADRPRW